VFQGSLPDHPILQGKNDLFVHLCGFLALTLAMLLFWPRWSSIAALALCAAAIEAAWIFEPRRTADLHDLAASLFGHLGGHHDNCAEAAHPDNCADAAHPAQDFRVKS